MFYHLQYIHLFRPFLKYNPATSPLPPHVSPRRICTANAGFISKLMRLYKKLYNLRQICNIAVYMVHSACTIHLLNLPEKTARRDIIHGVKHLEEIAEDWLCARRSLSIISVLSRKWNCELPEDAAAILKRTDENYGYLGTGDVPSPSQPMMPSVTPSPPSFPHSPVQLKTSPNRHDVPTPHMAQDANTAMPPDLMSTLGVGSIATAARVQPLQLPTTDSVDPTSNPSLAFSSSWTMPGVSAPAMPRYHQSYAPVQMTSSGPSTQSSRTATRNATPNSVYAIDGQDWFLKDGINWQQNFEGWGMTGPANNNTTNNNNNNNNNSNSSNPAGAGNGAGVPGSDVFMFKGLQGGDLDMGDTWDFDSSMTNLDQIPGLD